MTRGLLAVLVVLMAGCASAPRTLPPSRFAGSTVAVAPAQNLTSHPVRLPAIWLGDNLGAADALEGESLDLGLALRAALLAELRSRGYTAQAAEDGSGLTLHCALTEFEAAELRRTGVMRLGVAVVLAQDRREVARGVASRDYRLFEKPPEEAGALGAQRLIESRVLGFVELLAREALDAARLVPDGRN
ncbi:MAG: hypothetical protein IT463_06300 [Planctomycetes bacterium]|nr:hypothetical protein [Planctomycetota bacterium]